MMIRAIALGVLCSLAFAAFAVGQEYKVAKLEMAAPAAVAPEISSLLQPAGFKVMKGSATVFEMWPAKEWPIAADAQAGAEVLYPLTPGQLIGVTRYTQKGADFRDQEIAPGTYVVRYGQQPVDGAHVGTSPTRDFLLLLPAAKDRDPKTLDYKTLTTASKEASGTAHPAILSLQSATAGEPLALREDSERQWVVVHFAGKAKQGAAVKDLPIELVVVGKTVE
jgi:hypothetical protein